MRKEGSLKLAIAVAVSVFAFGNASGQDKPAKQPTAELKRIEGRCGIC
jgi:hypothetical protein